MRVFQWSIDRPEFGRYRSPACRRARDANRSTSPHPGRRPTAPPALAPVVPLRVRHTRPRSPVAHGSLYAPAGLTAREVDVLRTWVQMQSPATVAQELCISRSTVAAHLRRIRAKYSAVGRTAATTTALAARALQDDIVRIDDL